MSGMLFQSKVVIITKEVTTGLVVIGLVEVEIHYISFATWPHVNLRSKGHMTF